MGRGDEEQRKRDSWESRVPDGPPGPPIFRWPLRVISWFTAPPLWVTAALVAFIVLLALAAAADLI